MAEDIPVDCADIYGFFFAAVSSFVFVVPSPEEDLLLSLLNHACVGVVVEQKAG